MSQYLLWPCSHYNKKKRWIQGHTYWEITDLEFENHKSVNKGIFRTLEQAGANICSMGSQSLNFKVGLSLFDCAEKHAEKSTHCAVDLVYFKGHFFPTFPNLGNCITLHCHKWCQLEWVSVSVLRLITVSGGM